MLEALPQPPSPAAEREHNLPLGDRIKLSFRFKATCRPFIAYKIQNEANAYSDLNQYRITKRLSFETDYSHVAKDQYITTLIIDPFSYEYAGSYKLIVHDASDMDTKIEIEFQLHGEWIFNY